MPNQADSPHFNRWCVIDAEPIMREGVMVHHIYCSFADESQADVAAQEMNRLHIANPPEGMGYSRQRTKVTVIHYRYPYPSEA
jgi:hypothetical protein